MAERIIDNLEPVEVENQESKPFLVSPHSANRLAQAVLKKCPVGQACKCVMGCLMSGFRLPFFQLEDYFYKSPVKQRHHQNRYDCRSH